MPLRTSRWGITPSLQWTYQDDGTTVGPPATGTGFFFTVQTGGNDARKVGSGPGSYDKNDLYNRIRTAMGRNLGGRTKFFSTTSIANAVSNMTVDTPAYVTNNEGYPVLCFKSFTVAQLNARLDAITAPEIWVYNQEFYSTLQADWDAYNASHQTILNTINAHANKALVQLEMVSSVADERNNPGFFSKANGLYTASWGADSYNAKFPPYTNSQLFDAQISAFNALKAQNPNVKWIISEYGLSRYQDAGVTLMSGQQRIDYLNNHINYVKTHGCSGMTFWAVDNSNNSPIKDWSVDKGTAADNAFAAELARLVALYPITGL